MSNREEKLLLVRHLVHGDPHIVLDDARCAVCTQRACLYFCPAGCFTTEDNLVQFSYEGCLECGTCRLACPEEALTWNNPLGGYGVTFRMG